MGFVSNIKINILWIKLEVLKVGLVKNVVVNLGIECWIDSKVFLIFILIVKFLNIER